MSFILWHLVGVWGVQQIFLIGRVGPFWRETVSFGRVGSILAGDYIFYLGGFGYYDDDRHQPTPPTLGGNDELRYCFPGYTDCCSFYYSIIRYDYDRVSSQPFNIASSILTLIIRSITSW
jgi:hypothetical protein